MSIVIEVPDIGDFKSVEVIEVLVQAGDAVEEGQSLVTIETDKATMDIPSPHSGVIEALKVKVGDAVSRGTLIATLNVSPASSSPTVTPTDAAAVTGQTSAAHIECDVLVLGAGPGGYSAAFRAADLGLAVVLVERYASLGGVCLNVGCIPSKALLHVAATIDEARHLADMGVGFGEPQIDLDRLRRHKSKVVGKLTNGLAGLAKLRNVTVVRGYGSFLDSQRLQVDETLGEGSGRTGRNQIIRFKRAIIATGSQPVHLPSLPDDPRIVDSTGALALPIIPERMLIIGGGIIGLELGTVYSTLGARLDVVEVLDGLMVGADRDLVRIWQKKNARRFDRIMLKTRVVKVEAACDGIRVSFEGDQAPTEPQIYDMVLQAIGRKPNSGQIGVDKAGLTVTDRGFIPVDRQMRTSVPHLFAIGDIVGQPMLAHKAVHEGHVAAEVIAGELLDNETLGRAVFDARAIPSVAYTDPEIAWVGVTEDQASKEGRKLRKGLFPWSASGRAIANGRDEGFTKLLFDEQTNRIVGGAIVGTHAGELIGEIVLAIEMGADEIDIGRTIHPHPTLGESIGIAAEVAHGVCTDLPLSKS